MKKKLKLMPAPFIGCRYGKEEPLINTCKRIGAEATIFETTSAKKGYEELKKMLCQGEPAFIFVDMVYLPYMAIPETAHFGGHTIVVFGLDEEEDRGASSILNQQALNALNPLNEVAEMFEASGKVWSEIAKESLPDSWHTLKKIRELSFEKNRIFEEQEAGALEKK
ncbi:MAG: BtrH N-terminal domain-containing protein [bacterium]